MGNTQHAEQDISVAINRQTQPFFMTHIHFVMPVGPNILTISIIDHSWQD